MTDKEPKTTDNPVQKDLSIIGLTEDSITILAVSSGKGPAAAGQPTTPTARDVSSAAGTFEQNFGISPDTMRQSRLAQALPLFKLGPGYLGVMVLPLDKLDEVAGKGRTTGFLYPSQDPAALQTISTAQFIKKTSIVPAADVSDAAGRADAPQLGEKRQALRSGNPMPVEITTEYLQHGNRDLLAESLKAVKQAGGRLAEASAAYLDAKQTPSVASVSKAIGNRPGSLTGPTPQ